MYKYFENKFNILIHIPYLYYDIYSWQEYIPAAVMWANVVSMNTAIFKENIFLYKLFFDQDKPKLKF